MGRDRRYGQVVMRRNGNLELMELRRWLSLQFETETRDKGGTKKKCNGGDLSCDSQH